MDDKRSVCSHFYTLFVCAVILAFALEKPLLKLESLSPTLFSYRISTMTDKLNKSLSESNLQIGNLDKTPPSSYVITRNKRTGDHEMKSDFTTFKEEMKNMITSILSSHSNELQRITSTQMELQQTSVSIEKSISPCCTV